MTPNKVTIQGKSIDLQLLFSLPPERVMTYLKQKNIEVNFNWQEADAEARARAFSVANIYKLDLLRDIKRLVDDGIEKGVSLESFKQNARVMIESRGYLSEDEKISPGKLKNIFRQNMQTAYQAGTYKDLDEVKEQLPYWKYVAVRDASTTAVCSKLDGTVLPADDPFWDNYYPPNHFGCRSNVIALSKAQAQEEGITSKDEVLNTTKSNPLPQGFDINVGRTSLWDSAGEAQENYSFAEKTNALKLAAGQKNYEDYGLKSVETIPYAKLPKMPQLLSVSDNPLLAAMKAFGLSNENYLTVIKTPINNLPITKQSLAYVRDGQEQILNVIKDVLVSPFEIWATEYEDGYRLRFIGAYRGASAYIRINRDGSLYTALYPATLVKMNKLRIGYRLYGKNYE